MCKSVLNAHYFIQKRCPILGNVLKLRQEEKEREEACHLNGTFFFTSVMMHLAPSNGNKVYSRRRHVFINCERFHLENKQHF